MLNIINNLKPFFEDCYLELGVREYSRIVGVSPPTASKLLKGFVDEELLKMRSERGYLLFRANRESEILRDLSKVYWRGRLKSLGFIEFLNSEYNYPVIVLFGSLSKLEVHKDSDFDLVVFFGEGKERKKGKREELNLDKFEKKLGRKIQLFKFNSLKDVGEDLKRNILNGYIIQGELK